MWCGVHVGGCQAGMSGIGNRSFEDDRHKRLSGSTTQNCDVDASGNQHRRLLRAFGMVPKHNVAGLCKPRKCK